MTPEELAHIEYRVKGERCIMHNGTCDYLEPLIAEVKRLRDIVETNDQRLVDVWDQSKAEVERLKVELAESHEIRLGWAREVGKLAAERADLRAEVARLRSKNAPKPQTKVIGSLMWCIDVLDRMSWNDARAYAQEFSREQNEHWRLPTVQELVGLFDYDKGGCEAFPDADDCFWTSSEDADDPDRAWDVGFLEGTVGRSMKTNKICVRLVRDVCEEG